MGILRVPTHLLYNHFILIFFLLIDLQCYLEQYLHFHSTLQLFFLILGFYLYELSVKLQLKHAQAQKCLQEF